MADPQALPIIAQVESGNRNIPASPGIMTDSGQPQGYYQITQDTWKDFAPKAGVDLAKYKDPLSAPWDIQGKVASVIPLQRWAPSTVKAVNAMGLDGGAAGASDALGTNRYGFINPLIDKMEQTQAESEKATGPIRKRMQDQLGEDMARVHKAADNVEPVDIQKWTVPPPKNDPVDGFASIGAIFAGIASAFTHTPAINAMNGMAAAIEARKEGNETAYKQAYQAWKDNTELAIKRNEVQSKAFTQALDLMNTDVAAGHAALVSAASVYGDQQALLAAEGGLYGKVADAQATRDRMMMTWGIQMKRLEGGGTPGSPGYITNQLFNQIKQEHPEMSDGDAWAEAEKRQKAAGAQPTASHAKEADAETLAAAKFREVNGRDPDPNNPDDKTQLAKLRADQRSGASAKPLTEENAEMQARFYLRTGQLPSGFGGQAAKNQVTQRAAEIAQQEGKSVDDYLSGRASLRADTASLAAVTKQKNAAEGYERGAVKSLDLMQSLIPKTPEPLDNQTLTRWARTGATEFGDVDVPQWQAALIVALDQYAKVISGATGAQGSTDSARYLALSLIPAGATSAQIPKIINVLKKDMDLKVQGYDTQINDIRRGIAYPDQNTATPVTSGTTPAKTEGAMPPVPPALTGKPLQWSPSLKQWRDKSSGKVYDADGNPGG